MSAPMAHSFYELSQLQMTARVFVPLLAVEELE